MALFAFLPSAPDKGDPSLKKISFAVIACHFLILLMVPYLSSSSLEHVQSKPEKKLLVQTIKLKPEILEPAPAYHEPMQTYEREEEIVPQETESQEIVQITPTEHVESFEMKHEEPEEKVEFVEKEEPLPVKTPVKKEIVKPLPPKPKSVERQQKPALKEIKPKKIIKKKSLPQKKKAAPRPKPARPAKAAAPKTAAKPAQNAASERKKELLASAQKTLSKIGKSRNTHSFEKSSLADSNIPKHIEQLNIEEYSQADLLGNAWSAKERTYYDELAHRLKNLLRLPESGIVKLKLTLKRSGKFEKLAILSSNSSANKKYIEQTLPSLSFPDFGTNFDNSPEYTFIIALNPS